MAEAAAACTQPVYEIGKYLWAPITRRINYARKLSTNLEALGKKVSKLGTKRDDIVAEIERLNLQKNPTKECEVWKQEVVEMENKIETITEQLNVEKKCLGGLCPDIFALIELGEQVVNMISDIDILLDKSKFENGFLVDPPPAKVEKKPYSASKLSTSAYHTFEVVLNKIRDESSPKIGIWGMGGVGKTTVLELLNNSHEVTTLFDFVIWVTVSKSWSIRKLQNEVGKRLSLEITTEDSNDRVRSKLFQRLEGKKYVLLLDDVWDKVDLSVVGFPDANQENGCKVVLTTRKKEVCRKMGTYVEVHVVVLSDKEAWEVFYSEVGQVATLPTIRPYARDIVRECDGLPLALKVVGSALRKEENENIWRNFLRELRSPSTSFIEDLDENVFKILKVSYDKLKDIEEKKCLLFCGLYPEDSEIDKSKLIEYWRAEGILSKNLTLEEAHDKGDAILQGLIDASLLEKCDWYDYVKMHDVIRDLVLAMTSPKGEEPQQLVRAGIASEKIPDADAVVWKKATRISFIDRDLCNLPESPDCPELLTLLLQGNTNLEVISETFFNKMPKLQILDLSRTRIKSLPTSISKLDSLRELVLLDCDFLEFVPSLCGLSQMEVFELSIRLSDGNTEMVAKELSNMSSLSSLEFDFGRVDNLQHFLENSISWRERRLAKFWFYVNDGKIECIGDWAIDLAFKKYNKCLWYEGGGGEDERGSALPSAIENVLGRSNCFGLKGHKKLNTLSEIGPHNTYGLRHCRIEECVALEKIVNRNGQEMGAFPSLEDLSLVKLANLKSILSLEMEEGPLLRPPPNTNSFTNLKSLLLNECPRIEQLFSSALMVQQLSNLEVLVVRSCHGLKEMISDDQKLEYEALPKLRILWLSNLPEFESFLKGVPMCWQSLKDVEIKGCPKMRKLPFNRDSAPNLKKIEGERWWWEALEWDNDAIRLRFQPFFGVY